MNQKKAKNARNQSKTRENERKKTVFAGKSTEMTTKRIG
jgi:hypothetical protein